MAGGSPQQVPLSATETKTWGGRVSGAVGYGRAHHGIRACTHGAHACRDPGNGLG